MSDVQRQDCEGKEALIAWRAEVGAVRSAERAVRSETQRRGIVAPITHELAGAWAACGAFVTMRCSATLAAAVARGLIVRLLIGTVEQFKLPHAHPSGP